jgi:hypothetical protein
MTIFSRYVGQHCVVRTYSAGVHAGTVSAVEPTAAGLAVTLTDSVRIWRWEGALSLSEVSQRGVAPASRIAAVVPDLLLSQVIELLPTTDAARAALTTRNN